MESKSCIPLEGFNASVVDASVILVYGLSILSTCHLSQACDNDPSLVIAIPSDVYFFALDLHFNDIDSAYFPLNNHVQLMEPRSIGFCKDKHAISSIFIG